MANGGAWAKLPGGMRLFLRQLSWEFRKLCARRRTWLGFGAILLWHVVVSALLRLPAVRLLIQREVWKMRWDFEKTFSGLTTAAHLLGEATTTIGTVALAMVGADLVAQEVEDGSLRTTLCRPISRMRVLALKLIVCAAHSFALVLFNACTALAIGLLFEGRGPLIMIAPHEGVIGTFDFSTGLQRYVLATALLTLSALTGALIAFACSCFPLKPATAAAIAIGIFFTDNMIRATPGAGAIRPYCLSTRLIAWRQVFNEEVPEIRLKRSYGELVISNASLILLAACVFQRREFKP